MFDNNVPGFEKMTDFNKQMMASFAEMAELATTAQRKMATQQMAAFEANLGAAHKIMDAVAEGKKPAEVYALQIETAQSLGEDMAGYAREAWEAQSELCDQVVAIWSEKADAASAPVKKAAPKAAK